MAGPKQNCHNCKHLHWHMEESYESSDSSGNFCGKRQYKYEREERAHLNLLSDERYLETRKSCCELEDK